MIQPAANYPYPQLQVHTWKLLAEFETVQDFGYGWDFKISPDLQAPNLIGVNGKTGEEAKLVDCSGVFRWIMYRASHYDFGDGSEQQHEKIKSLCFKQTTIASVLAGVGNIYVLFLEETATEAGHVLIVVWKDGKPITIESHGGVGCKSRPFDPDLYPFMGRMVPYVLALAEEAEAMD